MVDIYASILSFNNKSHEQMNELNANTNIFLNDNDSTQEIPLRAMKVFCRHCFQLNIWLRKCTSYKISITSGLTLQEKAKSGMFWAIFG